MFVCPLLSLAPLPICSRRLLAPCSISGSTGGSSFHASSNPYQQQTSGRSRDPLVGASSTRRTPRSRTPLPPPVRASPSRDQARAALSKSASLQSEGLASPASGSVNTHRTGQYYHNRLPLSPVPVYDPVLPSPTVIVHQIAKNVMTKSVQERKHRGTSRNVLGGFYTS